MIRVSNAAIAASGVVTNIASKSSSFAKNAIQRLYGVKSPTLQNNTRTCQLRPSYHHAVIIAAIASFTSILSPQNAIAQVDPSTVGQENPIYKPLGNGESEFDNQSGSYVKNWRDAVPQEDYEDTEFGGLMYNEASTPTKLEILRLLSKDTPSMMVFMTALSMGLDIETIAQASAKYQPEKSRELAASAVNLLPVLTESPSYLYSGYELEDLEREEDQPYSVERVVEKFFEQRLVLRPYPDWFEGQFHFMASAAELKKLQAPMKDVQWYRSKSTDINTANRPIFVSLYEANSSVLIDGQERIDQALKEDPKALMPVVFIFNRLNERSTDQLGYPQTIKGVQAAYVERELMLTPAPEWQLGEYHMYANMDEFYELFNIPEEEDFEPEAWQKLLEEAEDYTVTDTAFLLVVLGAPDDEKEAAKRKTTEQLYAAWDDPRSESAFPYVEPSDGPPVTLKNLIGQGLVFSRPDLIAALNALGVTKVPVAFYYIDSSRVKPYGKGPRALIQSILGVTRPSGPIIGGSGGIICASPPCTEEEQ